MSLNIDPILEGDMTGYLDAAGQLMERGTTNRTKEQFNEEIDFIGARISASADGIYGASLKKHQEKLLDMMSDVLMNAEFKQEELDKIKKQMISGIASSKDDPDAIAANVRAALVYGENHPYGEVATEETVEAITLEKCIAHYKTYFKPNVAYLAIVGDVTVAEVKPLIEKYFGSWEKGDVSVNKYRTPSAPDKTQVAVVHKEGAVQSVINITYPISLKQNNPDVIKVKVMNAILGGGGFMSRLNMNLREGHAYTYGARSSIRPDKLTGIFSASAKVRNDVTDSSIVQFMLELNRIIDEKVTDDELQSMKNYMTGTFAYTLQNPQTIARFAINTEKYNLPKDYYANYLKNLAAVTVDDVQAMAKKYIKPENAYILVVGDKEVADKLKGFAASKEVDFYDTYGSDWVEPLRAAPEGMTAENVLDKFIEAKYGEGVPLGKKFGKKLKKKLKKIKDITVKMNASIQGQTISVTRYNKAPNKFAMSMTMGSMVIQKQTFDGTKGKVSGMQGNKDVEGEELEELKESSVMFGDVNYAVSGSKFTLLGVEPVGGKDAYKIEVIKKNGNKETEWYDVASNLQVKAMQVKNGGEEGANAITIISLFSDYKVVNGINYAHKIKQSFGPQTLDMEVTSVEQNTKLGDEIFE
ncbi:MAG: peptidase M16 [Flavobacteriales bacterium]|nr:MAG: peptidase M16 [Flavobacteriales bacterium]